MPYLANVAVVPNMKEFLKITEKMPSPRVIKTHLSFPMLHPDLLDTSKVYIPILIN